MARGRPYSLGLWVFLGICAFAALVRCQTFGAPFIGFDEQFYLLVGDRMVHGGALPFVDIFDRKPIGLFLVFAGVRALGGEGFLQYQLAALLSVAATALGIAHFTRRIAGGIAPIAAACLYVLWLDFMECEGGQSPVFYNGLMVLAALLTWRAVLHARRRLAQGTAAMLLVGLALQIKYTVLAEGVYFGLAMLWAARRDQWTMPRMLLAATCWAGAALLPTLAALGYYCAIGHGAAFVFANFISISGRLPDTLASRMRGLALIAAILLPLALLALAARQAPATRQAPGAQAAHSFVWGWLIAAAAGLLLFNNYLNPQSGAPLVGPLAILGSGFLVAPGRPRWLAPTFIAIMLALSQVVLVLTMQVKGSRADARALAMAALPRPGKCIYVYDGPPALYLLTGSCLPTRWPFPGHLDTQDEASKNALGVDPVAEVKRILATRPDTIIDKTPAYALGNPATHALVRQALADHYHLVLKLPTADGARLVYRLD